uniref:Uncharacterized protein n=1 Tax=Rhipicephalus zambeziensis TaxID=60191 RepID=A0A224Y978_9ACAR
MCAMHARIASTVLTLAKRINGLYDDACSSSESLKNMAVALFCILILVSLAKLVIFHHCAILPTVFFCKSRSGNGLFRESAPILSFEVTFCSH